MLGSGPSVAMRKWPQGKEKMGGGGRANCSIKYKRAMEERNVEEIRSRRS